MKRRLAAFAPAALLLAAVAVAREAEVVAEGRLLPYFESYHVTRVRLAGIELYVDSSTGARDAAGALLLAAAAAILLGGAARLRRPPGETLLTAGLGALFLAGDDLLAAHETVGHNLGFLANLPLVDHPDDAIVALYGAIVAGFIVRHRRLLAAAPRAPIAVAIGAGGLAVLHDVSPLHLRTLEETLEAVAAVGVLAATAGLVRSQTSTAAPVGCATDAATGAARRSSS